MIARLFAIAVLVSAASTEAARQATPAPGFRTTVRAAEVTAVAADTLGNVYLVGETGSRQFQTTPNAFKRTCDHPCYTDAILVVLDARGRVSYATYFGGSSNDSAYAVAVDGEGHIYVAGTTWSADFPVLNPIVATRSEQQGFVSKFSADGRLLFSTTLGGSGARGVAVGRSGDIFVTGNAHRDTVPIKNAIQPVRAGDSDAFVARVRADGSGLVYSTYLGGSRAESASGLALHTDEDVVVVGVTSSPDFPTVRAGRVQPSGFDAFVAAVSADGAVLEFSTLVGGRQNDKANGVAIAPDGIAYVIGTTESADFPITDDALDAACGSDGRCNESVVRIRSVPMIGYAPDGFLAAFDRTGRRRFSTFIGGSSSDEPRAIAISEEGVLYVSMFVASPEIARMEPPCDSMFNCAPVLYEIDLSGPRLLAERRVPVLAVYTPGFDYVPMTLGAGRTVVVVANEAGRVTVIKGPVSPR